MRQLRILAISNLYPPQVLGGCEILCAQACEALERRGHTVRVLTSGHGGAESSPGVLRELSLYQPFGEPGRILRLRRHAVGRENARRTQEAIEAFRPGVIFVWNLLRLTVGPARAAQSSGVPVVYTFNDENIASYLPARFGLQPRKVAASLIDRLAFPGTTLRGLDLRRSTCISLHVKEKLLAAGVAVAPAEIIYQGIPLDRFPRRATLDRTAGPTRVLYAGQLLRNKGVHTLIQAAHLAAKSAPLRLTIAGDGPEEVKRELRALLSGGPAIGEFLGRVPHADLPAIYRAHDLFVFPSLGPEAFGLTHLEAMASGTPVVSTRDGGQAEFLIDGENALVFPAGDAQALSGMLLALVQDLELARRLADNARELVERKFSLDRYISQVEDLLSRAAPEQGPVRPFG